MHGRRKWRRPGAAAAGCGGLVGQAEKAKGTQVEANGIQDSSGRRDGCRRPRDDEDAAERAFPVDDIAALASERSVGSEISFGDDDVKAPNLATLALKGTELVFSSPGAKA